jgi:hypothetical protein
MVLADMLGELRDGDVVSRTIGMSPSVSVDCLGMMDGSSEHATRGASEESRLGGWQRQEMAIGSISAA